MTKKNNFELDPDPETAAALVKPKLDEISCSMCMAKWLWTSIHLTNGTTNSCFLPPIHKIDPKILLIIQKVYIILLRKKSNVQ